jgi:hypothetical protein
MRVTIDIPDEIHAKLKVLAKKEGTTIRAIFLRAIDAELCRENTPASPEGKGRFEIPLARSKRPGTLRLGEEGVYEYIDFP